jgi:hypothetical protein
MDVKVPAAGFLSSEIDDTRPAIMEANAMSFALSKDANLLMMKIVQEALDSVHTTSWDPKAVVVRLLLRATGAFQGAMLLAERGMYVEGRIMARTLLEVSFSIGALSEAESTFMQMLRDDHFKSRRQRFVTLQKLGYAKTDSDRKLLLSAINALDKSLDLISPKTVSALGPLEFQYLAYQQLSDDSAHVSAASLDHYVEPFEERVYWSYKCGCGTPSEIEVTLYYILYALVPILVGAAELLEFEHFADELASLLQRFEALPHCSL